LQVPASIAAGASRIISVHRPAHGAEHKFVLLLYQNK